MPKTALREHSVSEIIRSIEYSITNLYSQLDVAFAKS